MSGTHHSEQGKDSVHNWQNVAVRKETDNLKKISQRQVVNTMAWDYLQNMDSLRNMCTLLRTSLPVDLLHDTVNEMVHLQKPNEPEEVLSLLLVQLLTGIKHITISVGRDTDTPVILGRDQCNTLLRELENCETLRFESIDLMGISFERGVISDILSRSSQIESISVSGDLCNEVLQHLRCHPCNLKSLHLDSSTVTDRDVVEGLLGNNINFEQVGNAIFDGVSLANEFEMNHMSLSNLSVMSPSLTICGALVLLHCLKHLKHFLYPCRDSTILDAMSLLQQFSPSLKSFELTTMSIWRPKTNSLKSLPLFAPTLRTLFIENCDPYLESLDALSELHELKSLTLHLISEHLIESAVKAVGSNLLELNLDFETCAYHTISFNLLRAIEEHCPNLQKLSLRNVTIKSDPKEYVSCPKEPVFPELRRLSLTKTVIEPFVLEHMLMKNITLRQLNLDVNKDALTDKVMESIIKKKSLTQLRFLSINNSLISEKTLLANLSLPAIKQILMNIENFPFISESSFSSLKEKLIKGNYQCTLDILGASS